MAAVAPDDTPDDEPHRASPLGDRLVGAAIAPDDEAFDARLRALHEQRLDALLADTTADAGAVAAAASPSQGGVDAAAAAFEPSSAALVDDDGLGSALGSHGVDAIASQLLGLSLIHI